MKRISFLKEKRDNGTTNIPVGNKRGDIDDRRTQILNAKIDLTKINAVPHSYPTIYSQLFIYHDACTDKYDNHSVLFSEIIDLIEIIYDANNYSYDVKLETIPFDTFNENKPFEFSIKSLNPSSAANIQIIIVEDELIGTVSEYTLVCPASNIKNTKFFSKFPQYFHNKRALAERNSDFKNYLFSICAALADCDDNESVGQFRSALRSYCQLNASQVAITDDNFRLPDELFLNAVIPLYKSQRNEDIQSTYKIDGSRAITKPPLVLENGWSGSYFNKFKFPENFCIKEESREFLPHYGYKYPWVSPSIDFFEEKIIILPYELNISLLHYPDSVERNLIVPLKPEFFKYFKVEDIPKILKIEKLDANGRKYKATMRIPTDGGGINIVKEYNKDDGKVIKIGNEFPRFAFFPVLENSIPGSFFSFCHRLNPEKYPGKLEYWHFAQDDYRLVPNDSITSNKREELNPVIDSFNHSDDLTMRYISQDGNGIFAIKFSKPTNLRSDSCKIAIDFGTTNTNVAVRINNYRAELFDTGTAVNLLGILANQPAEEVEMLREYFFPKSIGKLDYNDKFKVSLPMPTLLLEKVEGVQRHTDGNTRNIRFFDSENSDNKNRIRNDFKWGDNWDLFSSYNNLLLKILSNTMIAKGFDPENITYNITYPLAYPNKRFNLLKEEWGKIIDAGKITWIDESECLPYYFTAQDGNHITLGDDGFVLFDLGGGTSDFAIWKGKKILLTDSILLGGRDLTGSFLMHEEDSNKEPHNPFVRYIKNILLQQSDRESYSDRYMASRYNNSDLKFSYYLKLKEAESFPKCIFKESANKKSEFMKILVSYFIGSFFYYLGLLESLRPNKIEIKDVFFGGNSSRFLDWLVEDDFEISPQKEDWEQFFSRIYVEGSKINNGNIRIHKSKEPKNEVVLGALYSEKKGDMQQRKTKISYSAEHINYLDTKSGKEKLNPDTIIDGDDSKEYSYRGVENLSYHLPEESYLLKYSEYFAQQLEPSKKYFNLNNDAYLNDSAIVNLKNTLTGKQGGVIAKYYNQWLRQEIKRHSEETGNTNFFDTPIFFLGVRGVIHQLLETLNQFVIPIEE